jgi:hypothetical protein
MNLYKISGEYSGKYVEMLFDCNPQIIHGILSGITYPKVLGEAKVVIDIGANVGAFTR